MEEKILNKRKREHEDVLNRMQTCFVKVNVNIENEIRKQSRYIKQYLENIYEECEKRLMKECSLENNVGYVNFNYLGVTTKYTSLHIRISSINAFLLSEYFHTFIL